VSQPTSLYTSPSLKRLTLDHLSFVICVKWIAATLPGAKYGGWKHSRVTSIAVDRSKHIILRRHHKVVLVVVAGHCGMMGAEHVSQHDESSSG
jgi:hypothetical protein